MAELSFLDVTAADLSSQRLANRRSAAAARERIESRMGRFIYADVSPEEIEQRLDLVVDDLDALAQEASDEYGGDDPEAIVAAIKSSALTRARVPAPSEHTAAVHEAVRKPRMCPFHKDVVDISLAQGDPRSGFEALRDHWGGARHCEGEGYEGERCKFKPEMTTQSYWDDKAQRAEERRQERAEQLEHQQELEQSIDQFIEPEDAATEPIDDLESPGADVLDFPGGEVSESPAEAVSEVPMAMAAGVHHTAPGKEHMKGVSPKRNRQYEHIKENLLEDGKSEERAKEEAARTVNKQRKEHGETKNSAEDLSGPPDPQSICPHCQQPILPEATAPWTRPPMSASEIHANPGRLDYSPEEKQLEREMWDKYKGRGPSMWDPADVGRMSHTGAVTQCANCQGVFHLADNDDGLGGPEPTMDKRKWTPENLEQRVKVDDKDGRWPTREKDIIEPIVPNNEGKPKEIGEQVTEHQDVTQKKDQISQPDGSTFKGGPTTAVSSVLPNDADVNPIRELVNGNYDGFLPANQVQQAIATYRR